LTVALAVVFNLSLLGVFKYAGMFGETVEFLANRPLPALERFKSIALPLGISFFTFQAMSYVIDVYRGHVPVERRPLRLATYIVMFPQLIAGPIVRYETVFAELRERRLSPELFAKGVQVFILGLASKVLIANALAVPSDGVFSLPVEELSFTLAWVGAVAYTLQIYFDFAGYSWMAIGLGYMLGFHFPQNFDLPYTACSITDFWRRWHISLSTWFRDYLYIPLGGNRHGHARTGINLVVVFLLCGLWHGASWTFVLWGGYHGCFLLIERLFRGRGSSLPALLRRGYAMAVVTFGLALFRADCLAHAGGVWGAMLGFGAEAGSFTVPRFLPPDHCIALVAGILLCGPVPELWGRLRPSLDDRLVGVSRALVSAVLLVLCAANLAAGTYNPFIYFRF